MPVHVFYSFDKIPALYDKQGDKFGLVGLARAEFGKVHVSGQQSGLEFLHVHDFGDGHNGEAAEMGVQHKRLRVRVADDSYSGVSLNVSSSSSNFVRK